VICQARHLERAHAAAIKGQVLQCRLDCCRPPLHVQLQRAIDALRRRERGTRGRRGEEGEARDEEVESGAPYLLVLDVRGSDGVLAAPRLLERKYRASLITFAELVSKKACAGAGSGGLGSDEIRARMPLGLRSGDRGAMPPAVG